MKKQSSVPGSVTCLSDLAGKVVKKAAMESGSSAMRITFEDGTNLVVTPSEYDDLIFTTEVEKQVLQTITEKLEVRST